MLPLRSLGMGYGTFSSVEALIQTADELWASASRTEILEAFWGHARIGDLDALKVRYFHTTADRQGQILGTSETVIRDLHKLNIEYEQRHGFIFIVCATGKSAEQMLALLKERIDNSTSEEIINGAREQAAIRRLRILINDTGADHE